MENKWTINGVEIVRDPETKEYIVRVEKEEFLIEVFATPQLVRGIQTPIVGRKYDQSPVIYPEWVECADGKSMEFFVEKMREIKGLVPGNIREELYDYLSFVIACYKS